MRKPNRAALAGAKDEMQLMVLILVLFTLISLAGFIGAFFFGPVGATVIMVLGLSISFIGIAFFTGR